MRLLLLFLSTLFFTTTVFSQAANELDLQLCIDAAVKQHPLQTKKPLVAQSTRVQSQIIKKSALPSISWNAQARIQSENIELQFDNPMFPGIELPIYSLQSTIEAKYSIYDGGIRKIQNNLLINETESALNQIDANIDLIKIEVVKNFVGFMMLNEKEKVLGNNQNKLQDNIKRLESAHKHGLVLKNDILQLKIKSMELDANIDAIRLEKLAQLKVLESLTGMDISTDALLSLPELDSFYIDQTIHRADMLVFDLEKETLNSKELLIDAKKRPKIFAFTNLGLGYPNPLNFFDDNVGFFAIGGLGFSWNFIDWGKSKKEKQLIKIQKNVLDAHKANLDKTLNRYNEKYSIQISKYNLLIEREQQISSLREKIAENQKSRMERGVIVPVEYLNTLNDIIDSDLKLNNYKLEIIRLKLEYNIMKGIL